MVGHHALWLWFLLTAVILGGFCAFLVYLSRLRGLSTVCVPRFLRAADLNQVWVLMIANEVLRGPFSSRDFAESQQMNLHEIREFMLLMFHNMRVLIAWSASQLRMYLVEKPWQEEGETWEEDPKVIAAQLEVLKAARNFRCYALLAIITITLWLMFRTQWWLPVPRPRFDRLEKICGREFYPLFGNLIRRLCEVTLLLDEGSHDLKNCFLRALIKDYDPDDFLKNIPETGMIM